MFFLAEEENFYRRFLKSIGIFARGKSLGLISRADNLAHANLLRIGARAGSCAIRCTRSCSTFAGTLRRFAGTLSPGLGIRASSDGGCYGRPFRRPIRLRGSV